MTQCLHQKSGLNGGRQLQPKAMRILEMDLLEMTQGLEVPRGVEEEAELPDLEEVEPSQDRTLNQRNPLDLVRAGPRQDQRAGPMKLTLELAAPPQAKHHQRGDVQDQSRTVK